MDLEKANGSRANLGSLFQTEEDVLQREAISLGLD